jgi:dephospho-CoA kinase
MIVHPAVRAHFKIMQAHFNEEILLYESAILFESGQYKDFDYIHPESREREIQVGSSFKSRINAMD